MKLKLLHKVLIYIIGVIVGFICLVILLGDPGKKDDVLFRRNFLIKALTDNPSATEFFGKSDAQFMGEWTLVTYSMAAYALTNIAMRERQTAAESGQVIAKWIDACLGQDIYAFDKIAWRGENPLDPKILAADTGHVGYYGHLNLMLGCYALLNHDGRFEDLHKNISDAIAKRMAKYPHRHIETYPGETYPPDNTVAVASLAVADKTINTNYKDLIREWIDQSRLIEESGYGLIVFQIDSVTGEPVQTCRGSHIGWNSFFLPLVDEGYARQQFEKMKKHMLRRFGGFAAFKEFPKGDLFTMDCDTGPVIFGLGSTATAFSVAGARWDKNEELISGLLRSVELLGTSVTKGDTRRYLAMPIVGDAILLAMRTAVRWEPL